MRTKREQVAAHRFIVRRIVSAMVSGEPETLDLPMRRMATTAVVSVAIAALVFAGFWVVGLVWPGGAQSWQQNGAVIVEAETGTRYVYWEGTLHPVRNYASALLIISSGDRTVHEVHQSSLAGTPRGALLGIPDAPDALPAADSFTASPWQTCSAPSANDPTKRESHVVIGSDLKGGSTLGDHGILLSYGKKIYLVIGSTRYQVPGREDLPALGARADDIVAADAVLINSLHTGPDLALSIPHDGDAGPDIDGASHKVGDLFSNNGHDYVLLDDGLSPIGKLAAELIGTAVTALPTAVIGANQSDTVVEPEGFPSHPPTLESRLASATSAICTRYARGDMDVRVFRDVPQRLSDNLTAAPQGEDSVATADHVWLPGGSGALVRAAASPKAKGGTVFLVTDQGWKFGLTSAARSALGYRGVKPAPIPSALVALLPTGPDLSQSAALSP